MGWADRKYEDQGGGGARDALRRMFGDGQSPLDWSLPLYTAWGIRVRVHLIYVIYIAAELITSLARDRIGFQFKAMAMGGLFLLVLLHEYGHCFTCRWVGGTADRILMWPLGGLAYCAPPHHWKPSLLTTLGGPAVNAVLAPVFGVPLVVLAGWDAALFNPFDPGLAMQAVHLSDGTQPYWLFVLWWFYLTNLALLLFNMLLPMYPLDAGRVLQELLWRKLGYHRATTIAATLGLALAGALLIVAMVTREMTLLGVALFCGIICWQERRRLAATVEELEFPEYDFSRGYRGLPREDAPSPRDDRAAEKRRQREAAEQQRLDAILAKIAESGMSSLTRSERSWLRRTTEKKRRA